MVKEDYPNEQHLQNSSGNLGEGGAVQCTLESNHFVLGPAGLSISVDSECVRLSTKIRGNTYEGH